MSIDLAISFLSSSITAESRRESTARTARTVRAIATVAVLSTAPRAVTVASSEAFLSALRVAGKRPNANGVNVSAGDIVRREDEKAAISSFVGYSSAPHGVQLEQARQRAMAEVNRAKGVTPIATTRIPATVAGYVAGIPDAEKRRRGDLESRLRLAVDMATALRVCVTAARLANILANAGKSVEALRAVRLTDEQAKELAGSLAALEEARVAEIRADLGW